MSDIDPDLYRAIVEDAAEAIIAADRNGVVQVWNRGAERLFGYTASEMLGQSLDTIIPERFRQAHWRGYDRALAEGSTKYAERVLTTRSAHKDGSKLYVDLSFGLLRDRTGAVIGAFAIGRRAQDRAPAAPTT